MLNYLVSKSNEVTLKTVENESLIGVGNINLSLKTINNESLKGSGNINTDIYNSSNNNIKIGNSSLYSNLTGVGNIAIGQTALYLTTVDAYYNIAIGGESLFCNTTGGSNLAIGERTLYTNTVGYLNVGIGSGALGNNVTGYNNTAVGCFSSYFNNTGYNNTAVGRDAMYDAQTYSNCSALGYNTYVGGNNQVQLGDSYTTTYVFGTVQNRSDLRDKADVRDTVLGLEFINKLRPVDYRWDMREDYRLEKPIKLDNQTEEEYMVVMNNYLKNNKLSNLIHNGTKKRNRYHHGLIAQELKQVLVDNNIDFGGYQDHSVSEGDDVLSIGYDELIAPLIKAVQELSKEVKLLKEKTTNL